MLGPGAGALARVVPALQPQQAVHDPAGIHAHALARDLALAALRGRQGAVRRREGDERIRGCAQQLVRMQEQPAKSQSALGQWCTLHARSLCRWQLP